MRKLTPRIWNSSTKLLLLMKCQKMIQVLRLELPDQAILLPAGTSSATVNHIGLPLTSAASNMPLEVIPATFFGSRFATIITVLFMKYSGSYTRETVLSFSSH